MTSKRTTEAAKAVRAANEGRIERYKAHMAGCGVMIDDRVIARMCLIEPCDLTQRGERSREED